MIGMAFPCYHKMGRPFPSTTKFLKVKKCNSCHRYQWCLALCKRAERYVCQDEVKQKELLIGIPIFAQEIPSIFPPVKLSPSQKRIALMLINRVPRHTIAQVLSITRENLRNRIFQMKRRYWGD